MSFRRVLLPIVAVSCLALLVGCGSSTHSAVPPPSGGFSNTDFNGTYTFSILGSDANGTLAMAGSMVACGCTGGTISSGNVDLIDPSGAATNSTISAGTYEITQDGRGKASLTITTASGAVPVVLDFVLTSSSHGLIIRFDDSGTGSGTIDLQPTPVTQSSLANAYAFSVSGSDLTNNPLAAEGAFTLNSSGGIASSPAGIEDVNYDTAVSTGLALTGGITVGTGTAPGTAVLSATGYPLTFDVYAIDSTHLKLIESDGQAILIGDVFTQPTDAIPSGNLVFTVAGLDYTQSPAVPFAAGGIVSSDGASRLPTGAEDINEGGTVDGGTSPATPLSFSGTFVASPSGSGRFVFDLSGFAGGELFAAYPSSGGILLMQIDTGLVKGITGGVAMAPTGTSIDASQGYGLNLTGADLTNSVELDAIAEFQTTSSTFTSGLIDVNDGGPANPANFAGSYSQANGVGSATSLTNGLQAMFFYVVDNQTAVFISTDPSGDQVSLGAFQEQSTPSASKVAVAERHLAMVRSVLRAHSARKGRPTQIGH